MTDRWPIVSGRYMAGNPDRSVAVCTLASSDLVDQIGARDEIAIVGRLYTLNLGLEKLVRYLGAVTGANAEAICHTLVREGLISELSHGAYLGRETAKAEEALRSGMEYEQDRPLFPPGQGGRWAPFGGRVDRSAAQTGGPPA